MCDFRFKCEQLITDPEMSSINILIQSLYSVIGPQTHKNARTSPEELA